MRTVGCRYKVELEAEDAHASTEALRVPSCKTLPFLTLIPGRIPGHAWSFHHVDCTHCHAPRADSKSYDVHILDH